MQVRMEYFNPLQSKAFWSVKEEGEGMGKIVPMTLTDSGLWMLQFSLQLNKNYQI